MTLANVAKRFNSRRRGVLPPAVVVTDSRRMPDPERVLACLPKEMTVIFRHYNGVDRATRAEALTRYVHQRRGLLLVAADWRLAARCRADGVHLPEFLLKSGRLAPVLGWARRRGTWVTSACHSRMAVMRAARLGVDVALLSPVFPTDSHPGAPVIGATRFRTWTALVPIPVYALGGVTAARIRMLPRLAGFAAIGGWFGVDK